MRLYDYAASANCYKVRLLLAQLGLVYERVPVDIFAGDTLGEEYLARNPARETPVLETDEGFLPESGAILAFLAEGTPFFAGSAWERAQVLRWLLFEQTQVMGTVGGLRFRVVTDRVGSAAGVEARRAGARASLEIVERHLSAHEWLAGDRYSIADIAVFGYAHVAEEAGIALEAFPSLRRWLDAVRATPGYMNDLEPYPPNSMRGASRSIYD